MSNFTSLDTLKPVIWIPREAKRRSLTNVLFESIGKAIIFWYHWPIDGYAIVNPHEDYEPVILILREGKITRIGIRPPNRYKNSQQWMNHKGRPMIVFRTPWHEPIIYNNQRLARPYASIRFGLLLEEYEVTPGTPPDWFVKADSGVPVYEYARTLERLDA